MKNTHALDLEKHVLENGMTVITCKKDSAPIVSIYILVKAGSITESEFMGSGVSHYIEHMLFKGTKKRKVGEISRQIRDLGGMLNAYTTYDRTVYHVTVPSKFLDKALEIQADAIMHSSFDALECKKENQVILKEINMCVDEPETLLQKLAWETIYNTHPYKEPIIGHRELFENLSREDLTAYYKRMYVPNNMILAIAGDITHERALKMAKEAFKDFKRRSINPTIIPAEPKQLNKRILHTEKDVNIPRMFMCFHIPGIIHPDTYALDVLSIILGHGRSSFLYKALIETEQLVSSVESFSHTPKDTGVFGITYVLAEESIERTIKETRKQIELIKGDGLSKKDLFKAKRMVIFDHYCHMETVDSIAGSVIVNEFLTGDMHFSRKYVEEINKITLGDIQRVAEIYLVENNMSIITLKQKTPATISLARMSAKRQNIETKKINGMAVVAIEKHTTPIISVCALFKGGIRYENNGNNGICNLMQRVMQKGTKNRDAFQIAEEFETTGGDFSGFSGDNSFGFSMDILKKNFIHGLDIFADVIINPTFLPDQIKKERSIVLAEIKARRDEIINLGMDIMRQTVYKKHPYRFQNLGTERSLLNINKLSLINFYKTMCIPKNTCITVVGDMECNKIFDSFTKYFNRFNARYFVPEINIIEPMQREQRKKEKKKQGEQALVMIGFPTTTANDPHRYTFDVLTAILSDLGSRLMMNIREKRGLAYYVGSFSREGFDPGMYVFYAGTISQKITEAKQALFEEIQLLRHAFVSNAELQLAKNNLMGKHRITHQSNKALCFSLAMSELYGLGYKNFYEYERRIKAVTKESIKEIAQKYFKESASSTVVVRP
ncbi:MAG: pitrilysin family protein [bacterium]|nr:pitrilysin family protein [bacterium]